MAYAGEEDLIITKAVDIHYEVSKGDPLEYVELGVGEAPLIYHIDSEMYMCSGSGWCDVYLLAVL